MKAKEYLQQVDKLDRVIRNKLIEVEQWKSVAAGTSSPGYGERVKASGNQQKMADAVCKYVEIEKEIISYIDNLIDTKNEIIRTIEVLPASEYDILHKIYIQGMSLDDAAASFGEKKSYTWATTVHGRALKHVQDILDERGKKTNGNNKNLHC